MAKIVDRYVSDGMPAVDYTVNGPMCRLAKRDARDPRMKKLAASLRGDTELQSVRNAFNYVVKNVPYKSDPATHEYVQAPIYTLGLERPRAGYRPQGDCDCQVTALGSLLLAMGISSSIRTVAWREPRMTHVNLRAHLKNGTVIPLDATLKGDPGGGWNTERPATYSEKVYRCLMLVRSLEDGPGSAQMGCGCGGGRNCRCGRGTRPGRRGGCCPQNQATANSPVNVVVNTGSVNSTRSTDTSSRFLDRSSVSPSRAFNMNVPSSGNASAPSDSRYIFESTVNTDPIMSPSPAPTDFDTFSPSPATSAIPSGIVPPSAGSSVSVKPFQYYKEFP